MILPPCSCRFTIYWFGDFQNDACSHSDLLVCNAVYTYM